MLSELGVSLQVSDGTGNKTANFKYRIHALPFDFKMVRIVKDTPVFEKSEDSARDGSLSFGWIPRHSKDRNTEAGDTTQDFFVPHLILPLVCSV
jgi:hypothetical protein